MHSIVAQSEIGRRPSIRHQTETGEHFGVEKVDRRTGMQYEKIA